MPSSVWSRGDDFDEYAEVRWESDEIFSEKRMYSRSGDGIPTLIQGINYNKNRTDDVQALQQYQDEGLRQGIVVPCANSKRVVRHDPSKRGFNRRVAVGEIASESREEVISFAFGLLPAQKYEG